MGVGWLFVSQGLCRSIASRVWYKFAPFACLPPPLPMHTSAAMPAPVINNATAIWDINVHWPLSSQCGTWDAKGRGVDVWECILARTSSFLARPPSLTDPIRLLHPVHVGMSPATHPRAPLTHAPSATEPALLAVPRASVVHPHTPHHPHVFGWSTSASYLPCCTT